MGKIIIRPGWDRLAREAAEARNAGLHYGDYKGAQYALDQARREARERVFQAYLEKKEAAKEARRVRKQAALKEKERETPKPTCKECGKELSWSAGEFCSRECWLKYNQEELAEKARQRRAEARKKRRAGLSCIWCGKDIAETGRRLYCSEECARRAKAQRAKEKRGWTPEV